MAGYEVGRRSKPRSLAILVLLSLLLGLSRPVVAQIGSDRYASIVIDAGSGAILSQVNADEYRFPASLTKMMTLYMLFEALRDRRVTLFQPVPVSSWAASMSPTKLGLLPGSYITVEQALLGLVTKSANDAAAALGELLGGDEDRFAELMTLRARALGMTRSTFRNASGLPDWGQVTTARDMATLARHLIQDFPSEYQYFSRPSFVFRGRTIWNHQRMLQTYPGADGLKTGYIDASGYNLVTSAIRSDRRLIGVVLGASSNGERDLHMASLLDQGFDRLGVPTLMARQETPAPYRMGGLISLAQAAPIARRQVPPGRAELRPAPLRTAAGTRGMPANARRAIVQQPDLRIDRLRPRAIMATAPTRAARPVAMRTGRDATPARPGRGVRTANGSSSGRYPG